MGEAQSFTTTIYFKIWILKFNTIFETLSWHSKRLSSRREFLSEFSQSTKLSLGESCFSLTKFYEFYSFSLEWTELKNFVLEVKIYCLRTFSDLRNVQKTSKIGRFETDQLNMGNVPLINEWFLSSFVLKWPDRPNRIHSLEKFFVQQVLLGGLEFCWISLKLSVLDKIEKKYRVFLWLLI